MPRLRPLVALLPLLLPQLGRAQTPAAAAATAPAVHYHVGDFDVAAKTVHIAASVAVTTPTIEWFLPRWSPGFYKVEDYAAELSAFTAHAADGKELAVEHPAANRWHIDCAGAREMRIDYVLHCDRGSVTQNQIAAEYAVLCGPATFIGVVGDSARPAELEIAPPAGWDVAVALPTAEGAANGALRHRAASYDLLLDAPIVVGKMRRTPFDVAGQPHELVDFGNHERFDAATAVAALQPIAAELGATFAARPFARYLFLNGLRAANGGLEHLDSTLLSTDPRMRSSDLQWLSFVAHEYCHAFNVKRLRPVELGPFDYENPPRTGSLWVAEGLTTWFGDLAVARSGRAEEKQWLSMLSGHIRSLQNSPGRRKQTLEQASLDVWSQSTSGVGGDPRTTVSYYVKGPVVGFVLEARIRMATDGKRGLDDAMALAYSRYSGTKGFTPAEFEGACGDVAGVDLAPFFATAIRSTDELDYAEALRCFGLRFAGADDDAPRAARWKLEVDEAADAAATAHRAELLRARRK